MQCDELLIKRIANVECLDDYKALVGFILHDRKNRYISKFVSDKGPSENAFLIGAIIALDEIIKAFNVPPPAAADPTVKAG